MQDLSREYKCYNYFMVITSGNFLCFNDEYIVHLRCTIPWFIQYHVGMEMRLCFYARQHICYSAYMLLPVRHMGITWCGCTTGVSSIIEVKKCDSKFQNWQPIDLAD